jgi:hypothetical protein
VPTGPALAGITRTAGTGIVLAGAFDILLFITCATAYAASNLFLFKIVAWAQGDAKRVDLVPGLA